MVLGAGSAPPGRRTWSGQRQAAPPPTKAAFHAALQGARRVSSHKNGPKFHPNGWALKWPKRCQSHGSNLSLLRGSPQPKFTEAATKRKVGADELTKLRETRDALAAELAARPDWVLGSLVETVAKRNGKKTPFRCLSHSVEGRNRILYVAARQMAAFGAAVEAGQRAVRLLEEIAAVNARIIKAF